MYSSRCSHNLAAKLNGSIENWNCKQLVFTDNAGMKLTHGNLRFTAKMKNIAKMQLSLLSSSVITVYRRTFTCSNTFSVNFTHLKDKIVLYNDSLIQHWKPYKLISFFLHSCDLQVLRFQMLLIQYMFPCTIYYMIHQIVRDEWVRYQDGWATKNKGS